MKSKSDKKDSTRPGRQGSLPKSEKEFWEQIGKRAKGTLQQSLSHLGETLIRALKPLPWVKKHPIPTTGAVALFGFFMVRSGSRPAAVPKLSGDSAPTKGSWAPVHSKWILQSGLTLLTDALTPVLTDLFQRSLHLAKD